MTSATWILLATMIPFAAPAADFGDATPTNNNPMTA